MYDNNPYKLLKYICKYQFKPSQFSSVCPGELILNEDENNANRQAIKPNHVMNFFYFIINNFK